MPEEPQSPEEIVEEASIDVNGDTDADDVDQGEDAADEQPRKKRKKAPAVDRPYPRRTLEEALRVPRSIRENNGGNPWAPTEVAKSLEVGMSAQFFYLTAASRDFGLTEGTRDAQTISLTDLGKQAVYPTSAEAEDEAKLEAFYNVDLFKSLVEYYGGANLPADEFLRNTLETTFGLDSRAHEEFIDLFKKNARYVGIGAEAPPPPGETLSVTTPEGANPATSTRAAPGAPISIKSERDRAVCFVIMPFVERTDDYATGFFDEVFASLFRPAIDAAGFEPRTARRQGSDVIHSTIVTELMDADLVLADLTEHNPNVLFELGVRMTLEQPTALARAKGTGPIFDVDNMLRVESYNPNLWPSTVEKDIPRLTAHLMAAWNGRETDVSFMKLLRRGQVAEPRL